MPKFANFVKNQYFRHDGQFSSFRQFIIRNEILWSLAINDNNDDDDNVSGSDSDVATYWLSSVPRPSLPHDP